MLVDPGVVTHYLASSIIFTKSLATLRLGCNWRLLTAALKKKHDPRNHPGGNLWWLLNIYVVLMLKFGTYFENCFCKFIKNENHSQSAFCCLLFTGTGMALLWHHLHNVCFAQLLQQFENVAEDLRWVVFRNFGDIPQTPGCWKKGSSHQWLMIHNLLI